MRLEVANLVEKGPLPPSISDLPTIREWQHALEKITAPVSDEEAIALVALFPKVEDECFGLAWTLVHLIETAPHWPLPDCLHDKKNPWIVRLRNAAGLLS